MMIRLRAQETGGTTSTVSSAGIDRDRHRGPRRPRVRKAKPDIAGYKLFVTAGRVLP
jgi:hypothetical protein